MYKKQIRVCESTLGPDQPYLRGHLIHNLVGGVHQGVLQVVFKVAEELASSSLDHIKQPSSIAGVHVYEPKTFSRSEYKNNNNNTWLKYMRMKL